jgi:hypothetical protein
MGISEPAQPRPDFGGDAVERHALAVARTEQWAEDAAAAGEYVETLSWLGTLAVVEGGLSPELAALRDRCISALGDQSGPS